MRLPSFFDGKRSRIVAASIVGALVLGGSGFLYYYIKLSRVIDQRLAAGPFSNSMDIFSAPSRLTVGDLLTPDELVALLRRRGYTAASNTATAASNTATAASNDAIGRFSILKNAVEIIPGRDSHTSAGPSLVEFSKGQISRILSLPDHTKFESLTLEPQLIANFSANRERRRLVRFADIPASLVHAVISVEDKHFFGHSGFDIPRILKAAYVDVRSGRKDQGASTLTMQLARSFWLEPEKRWKRKLEEFLITAHIEHKLTKQKIFEYYANQVYLGRRDTFSISGFAEGARTYFGKDLSQISNAEAALLAGLVQRPSYYNPYRYPARARQRRNLVLSLMRRNGYLGNADYRAAVDSTVKLAPEQSNTNDNQYFIDLVKDEVHTKFNDEEADKVARKIYTTLDPDLQEAAQAAVRAGMEKVDALLRKRKNQPALPGQPQVALVALDPRTGEVKALVGGRSYRASQLDHAVAMRQPGSVFKPFVYAAAINTALERGPAVFTPASILNDSPSTFYSGGQVYQPGNYHHEFTGDVSLHDALARSLNVPTVNLAAQVGYNKVVQTARRAGLNDAIKPTPSVALGAYEATPLEIAGAYTTFANQGVYVNPAMVSQVRAADGRVVYRHSPQMRPAMDPRVAFVMVSMLQDVLRMGTGAGVRSLGFTQPAAGKTGTSRDGWFAGFTSELLCVVWVGFDDNRDLNLEGAHSALPIFADFMKRAAKFSPYRDAKPFRAPAGIRSETICDESGEIAGPYCPDVRTDVFISGSEPVQQCSLHNRDSLPPAGIRDTGPPRPGEQ